MDTVKKHRSHISSSEAKSRGWSRIPSPAVQRETRKQEVGIDYMSDNFITFSGNTYCVGSETGGFSGIGDGTSWPTTTATSTTDYSPYQTWGNVWISSDKGIVKLSPREIIKDKEVTMEKRTLFAVYVVDPRKNGKILLDGKRVIAVNENQAMLKAGVAEVAEKEGLELEQVDVYVDVIGTFIRPRKETQKVKVVEKDED